MLVEAGLAVPLSCVLALLQQPTADRDLRGYGHLTFTYPHLLSFVCCHTLFLSLLNFTVLKFELC